MGGYFENFVNMNCAPTDSPIAKEVMGTVSKIAQKRGMNSQYAGSVHIDGFSDVDIWIETYGKVGSNQETISFATELINELKNKGYTDIEGPDYKLTATSFYTVNHDVDIVFSNAVWINQIRIAPPNNQDFH